MAYTLQGKIARAHPYQLDKTLTVEGAGAEAKATGEKIKEAKKIAEDHIATKTNPHNVTKAQLGLDQVDNTPDTQKPVSVLQAEAIADAKKAGTDAQTAAENAQKSADNAQQTANGKVSKKNVTISLFLENWANNQQSVNVDGVTPENDVFVSAAPASYTKYAECMVHCTEQGDGSLTFACVEIPVNEIYVNVIIFE